MKKLLLISSLAASITTHGQTTVAGTYRGKLPCADCSGIEETLILKCKAPCHSGTYKRHDKYLDTPDGNVANDQAGKWKLIADRSGNGLDTLQLDYNKPVNTTWYFVTDKTTLQPLDKDKQPIDAPFDMSLRKKK